MDQVTTTLSKQDPGQHRIPMARRGLPECRIPGRPAGAEAYFRITVRALRTGSPRLESGIDRGADRRQRRCHRVFWAPDPPSRFSKDKSRSPSPRRSRTSPAATRLHRKRTGQHGIEAAATRHSRRFFQEDLADLADREARSGRRGRGRLYHPCRPCRLSGRSSPPPTTRSTSCRRP